MKEAGFTVSLSNETHLTKEMAEQLYGEHRDKEYFDDLTNMMTRSATHHPSFLNGSMPDSGGVFITNHEP